MKNLVFKLMMVCSLFLCHESLSAQIIGNSADGTLSDEYSSGYLNAIRYQCAQSMTVTQIKVKISVSGSGNIKCAIYSDENGSPGAFLMGTNELTNPGIGWKSFTLTSGLSLTAGSWYHIVVWPSADYEINYTINGVGLLYRSLSYGAWPGSFGSADSWPGGTYCMYAEGTSGCSNPVITNHPLSITHDIGSSATFSVSATGTNPTYQWKKDGSDITDATSSSYTKNPVTSEDAGSYTVVVSACSTSVTSNVATLTIGSGSGSAQWNGTNPVWTNNSVGIGTMSPGTNLDVVKVTSGIIGTIQDVLTINAGPQTYNYPDRWGNGGGTGLLFKQQHYTSGVSLASARIATVQTDQENNSGKPALVFQTGDGGTLSETMRISYNGNVGIGTANPGSPIEISSTNDNILRLRQNEAGEVWNYIEYYNSSSRKAYVGTDNGGNFQIGKDQGSGNLLLNYGNVGIGTTNPGNYQLNVNGKIRANEIVVNTTGADFVFAPEYCLPALSEVEEYIKEHKHLPDIKPASSMQEDGMNLSEMQTIMLQKIEELTLYIINQQKEIEILKQNIQQLSSGNNQQN